MGFWGNLFRGRAHETAPVQTEPAPAWWKVEDLWHQAQEMRGKKVAIHGVEIEGSGYMYALAQLGVIRDKAQGQKLSPSRKRDFADLMFPAAMIGVADTMQQSGNSLSDFIQINTKLLSFWNARVLPFTLAHKGTGQIKITEIESAVSDPNNSSLFNHTIRSVFEPILDFINLS